MHILLALIAYLLGSIPTSYWIGKIFFQIDIRNHGSGNAGATNTLRVLGWKVALPVLILDILKGYFAVKLYLFLPEALISQWPYIPLIYGILAVIGHIFPIFAGFRGGKGVATTSGVLLAVNPYALLICLAVFLLFVIVTRMVSAGSVLGAFSLPFLFSFYFYPSDPYYFAFSLMIFILVVYKHFSNIKRIIQGTENKLSFRKK